MRSQEKLRHIVLRLIRELMWSSSVTCGMAVSSMGYIKESLGLGEDNE